MERIRLAAGIMRQNRAGLKKACAVLVFNVFLCLFPHPCFSLELSLEDALRMAKAHNAGMRINDLALDISEAEIQKKKAAYIPVFYLDSSYNRETDDDADTTGLTGTNHHFKAGVTQKVPLGGELSLSLNGGQYHYSDYDSEVTSYYLDSSFSVLSYTSTQTTDAETYHYSGMSLSYAHHLLKDGLWGPAFPDIKESLVDREIQAFSNEASLMRLAKTVEIAFFETDLRQKEAGMYEELVEMNETLLSDLQAKHQLGLIPEIDILSARIEVHAAKETLLSCRSLLEDSVNTLKTLLNTDAGIRVVSQYEVDDSLPETEILLARAKNRNREILGLRKNLAKQELAVSIAKNKLLPQVDIYASLSKQDWENDHDPEDDYKETEYSAGIFFSYPLDNKNPRENYIQEKRRFEQVSVRLREAEFDILNQVKLLVRQLELARDKLSVQSGQVKILKERMTLSLKAFHERLIDLKRFYDIQEDLIAGEKKYLYHLFQYQSISASLKELTGMYGDLRKEN